ncbi:beta-fructofuranosidase [Geosmithia morbida]|uniref:Beta-fructofuranosidase n=1 Tax=Geosmithia morbida TaxID=1094350 RepID=A0A9P4YVD4_9HYPO|nr:beta-fructofuranosidase [Geosmithia morbida]KAF4123803.1 beta-fructofuranosidase [Geosmithia morbida]
MISLYEEGGSGSGLSKFESIDFRDPYLFYNDAGSRYRMPGPNPGTVYRVARGPLRIPRDGSCSSLNGRRRQAVRSCPRFGRPDERIYFGCLGDYVDEQGKWLWGGNLSTGRVVSADTAGYLDIAPEFRKALIERTLLPLPEHVLSSLSSRRGPPRRSPSPTLLDLQADLVIASFNVQERNAHSFEPAPSTWCFRPMAPTTASA